MLIQQVLKPQKFISWLLYLGLWKVMNKTRWIWLVIFLAGLLILLLPDSGPPIIEFNNMHGPSMLDLAGIVLIVSSWIASSLMTASRWNQIKKKIGSQNVYFLVMFYLLLITGIVLALELSVEWLLWLCVVIAFLINTLFIVFTLVIKNKEIYGKHS